MMLILKSLELINEEMADLTLRGIRACRHNPKTGLVGLSAAVLHLKHIKFSPNLCLKYVSSISKFFFLWV